MRTFILFLCSLAVSVSWAAPQPRSSKVKTTKKRVSREVDFDELLVQGKHHFSDEAVVTVEQDKVLDALLEIRKDFKDRMKKSAKRN